MNRLVLSFLLGSIALGAATTSYAADLIIDQVPEAGVVDVGSRWDGVFVGGFLGYGSAESVDVYDWLELVDGDRQYDLSGWLAGVTIGANYTVGNGIVAGIVADLAWNGIAAEEYSNDADYESSFDIDWTGSLRGRVGFDAGDFLPYLTAGLAVAGATNTVDGDTYSDTQIHVGWTVGAGVEFAIADDLSLDLLYRYSDYGAKGYYTFYGDMPFDVTAHTVQAGLNFKF